MGQSKTWGVPLIGVACREGKGDAEAPEDSPEDNITRENDVEGAVRWTCTGRWNRQLRKEGKGG